MTPYLLIFFAGLAGSFHCIGMCGGFACAIGVDPRGRSATLRRHLIYNIGRVTTYCFLGAVVGHFGMLLVGHGGENTPTGLAQRGLAIISGLLMVFIGLQFLGLLRTRGRLSPGHGGEFLVQALRDLLKISSASAPLAFGVLNGFLPCPLVYAFAAQAAASGGPLPGTLTMAAFGLGTFPAMLLMGGVGSWLWPNLRRSGGHTIQMVGGNTIAPRSDWRRQGVRIAGGFIVLLGIITFARGLLPLAAHLHSL